MLVSKPPTSTVTLSCPKVPTQMSQRQINSKKLLFSLCILVAVSHCINTAPTNYDLASALRIKSSLSGKKFQHGNSSKQLLKLTEHSIN